jgi:flagellar hook-associated protein 1 FlgK
MSDLLRIGASGISAYRSALSVIGENVANAETKGYARREVTLKESGVGGSGPLYRPSLSGGGVKATGVDRAWNDFKAADARNASGDAGSAGARAQWLGAVESVLPDGDSGISARITDFFNAANRLSADPTSTLARTNTLSALGDAVDTIKSGAAGLTRVADGISADATATVASVDATLAALAKVNASIARAPDGTSAKASLADERDRLLDGLSSQLGIDVKIAADGTAGVTLAGSPDTSLLTGTQAASLALSLAADGRISFTVDGAAKVPSGGRLAGLADAAAATADARTALDKVAVDFAGQLNSWQAQGRTPDKVSGPPLLSVGATAASLALATTNPAAIAAASADGTANGNLATLADMRGADGPEARMSGIVTLNAQALAAATAQSSAAGARRDAAFVERDDVSGVDLDREAAELIRFQQAYDGSARIIQVARETLQSILQLF